MRPISWLKAAFLLEAGLVVSWSSGFIAGELASDTASIHRVLFWRFVLAAALMLPFCARAIGRMGRREIALHLALGGLAMFGYLFGIVTAIDRGVSAGLAALIAALQPLLTAALAGIVLREAVSVRQWLGLAIGLAGVGLAVGGGFDAAPVLGYAFALLGMVSLTVATLIAQARPSATPMLPALAVQCMAAASLFAPFALRDGFWPEATADFAFAVLWWVGLSTFAAYGFYWACLKQSSATRVSSLIYLTPPVTAVWAFLMLGQPIALASVVGFGVCLLGVALAGRGRQKAECPAADRAVRQPTP